MWIASLLKDIKESIDAPLEKDYSAKPLNMMFLMNEWYMPTHIVEWDKVYRIHRDTIMDLFAFLNHCSEKENYDIFFPFTIWFTKRKDD